MRPPAKTNGSASRPSVSVRERESSFVKRETVRTLKLVPILNRGAGADAIDGGKGAADKDIVLAVEKVGRITRIELRS